jgi:bifunctional enzyme CysN/CysC
MPQPSACPSSGLPSSGGPLQDYLDRQNRTDLLRFITCGSVDDGKSTLIGRLLYDAKTLFEDQLSALSSDSVRHGTTGGDLDLALLVDGLAAEREQGITIDVAYRFFATERRKFIVADTPGHEQYTRNMVTGASTAELAVLLVDARKGVLTQTRRHSFLVSLLGIRDVVVAINKMDLVDYSQARYEEIAAEYRTFAAQLGIPHVVCLPVSALRGDNVISPAAATMPWYQGPTLLAHLETVTVAPDAAAPFRFPVQWVSRPHADFRGYAGTVASGTIRPGDRISALPGGQACTVTRIVTLEGDLEQAVAGQAVTLTLDREIDISRGDMIAGGAQPQLADQFAAHVVWMDQEPMLPERKYRLQFGPMLTGGQITNIKHAINVNTLEHLAASHLDLNGIAFCTLALDRPVPFDPYAENRHTGRFILIDRMNNRTVGCGMIAYPLRRAENLHHQLLDIDKRARASLMGQKSCLVWFTGLSGAGKSTVANLVERGLFQAGRFTYLLDGDNVRFGLTRDLGFRPEDRVENVRRVAECARLFVDAGLITLVSLISPFRRERQMVREMLEPGEFLEVWINTPLAVCEARDPKGLYRKARAGRISNFTGIDSPYEPPEAADLILSGETRSPEEMAEAVLDELRRRGFIR